MWLILTPAGTPLCWRAGVDGVERDTPILFETRELAERWCMDGDRVVACRTMGEAGVR